MRKIIFNEKLTTNSGTDPNSVTLIVNQGYDTKKSFLQTKQLFFQKVMILNEKWKFLFSEYYYERYSCTPNCDDRTGSFPFFILTTTLIQVETFCLYKGWKKYFSRLDFSGITIKIQSLLLNFVDSNGPCSNRQWSWTRKSAKTFGDISRINFYMLVFRIYLGIYWCNFFWVYR